MLALHPISGAAISDAGGAASDNQTILVPLLALVLTGFAPVVFSDALVDVPAGGLSLTGFAPTVLVTQTVDVPAGALTLTALAPTVVATNHQVVAPPAGSLTLAGFAPTVVTGSNQVVLVPRGTLTLTRYAPTVVLPPPVVAVPRGTLTLTGYAPLAYGSALLNPPTTANPRQYFPKLLLTEPLPLRLSTQLGAFEEEQPLAHRYGDLRKSRFRLLKLTSRQWFAADHPMTITRVFVDNLETKSFDFKTEAGAEGHSYTVVNLLAPAPLGATVTACGVGKLHSTTGALIENPGDMAADIMAIADRFDPWWGQLRTEASIASLALAGSVNTLDSVQQHLDTVVGSAGGIWCYGMARLYPLPVAGDTFVLPLDKYKVRNLKVSASLTDTADVLRLAYDFDEAEGRAQSYVELAARPARFRGIHADLTLPLLRGAAAAEVVGRRLLGRKAGQRFDVTFDTDENEFVRPGTWVLLQDLPQWPFAANPYVMILGSVIDRDTRSVQVRGETVLSTPTIDVIGHSLGIPSIGKGGLEVEFVNGVATITVRDDNDKPMLGAFVSLDGSVPKKTDAQGKVSFVTTSGQHVVAVEAPGYVPYQTGFEL